VKNNMRFHDRAKIIPPRTLSIQLRHVFCTVATAAVTWPTRSTMANAHRIGAETANRR
jgi:hypothetical protein